MQLLVTNTITNTDTNTNNLSITNTDTNTNNNLSILEDSKISIIQYKPNSHSLQKYPIPPPSHTTTHPTMGPTIGPAKGKTESWSGKMIS